VKGLISEKDLEGMLLQPLMFPLEVSKGMNVLQRQAVEEFAKNNLLPGGLFLEISPERGFLNPNALAVDLPLDGNGNPAPGGSESEDSPAVEARKEFQTALAESIKRAQDNENEENPERWQGLDPERLVQELTTYVSIMGRNDYVTRGATDFESVYFDKDTAIKYGKMSSLSEMYALAGWSEDLINLMIDQISVHNAKAVSINHITESQLKFLLPDLSDEQVKEFFRHRDGDPGQSGEDAADPHSFKSADEFLKYFKDEVGVDTEEVKKRMDKLGLTFSVASDVFKVLAKGSSNDATYELEAYVRMPTLEVTAAPTNQSRSAGNMMNEEGNEEGETNTPPQTAATATATAIPQLAVPRTVEIMVL